MPSRLAWVNKGAVSLDGISRSKNESTSAWSVIHQRGKNVVRVSSGNTTSSQPMRLASRRWAISRSTTSRRVWLRWMGPICAAPTVRKRVIITFPGDYCCWRRLLQALRAGAFYIVGELGRAESTALEEIADRIGADFCLLGLGMPTVILAFAGRTIAELAGPRIFPP